MTNQPPSKELVKSLKLQIRDLLQGEEFKRQVARALPRTMNPERFARIALTTTYKNPKLLSCTRESLRECLIELSAIGLEPDGRRAHLIPYGEKCTLIIDYKGIAELIRRNGDVSYIHCDVVGENDTFVCRFGTGGRLEHIPAIGERGKIYCAYSFVRLKDGTEEFDLMSTEEIERVRARSRAANDGPWVTDWNEMAKKTIFRRHSKTLPLSPEIRDVVERDDEILTESEHFAAAKPAIATVASDRPRVAEEPRRSQAKVSNAQESEASPAQDGLPEAWKSETPQAAAATEPDESTEPFPETKPRTKPSLAQKVEDLLTENGFSVAELSTCLRQVKLIKADVTNLDDIPVNALQVVVNDWENCQRRLSNNRRSD
jgi:recombination protein RecT